MDRRVANRLRAYLHPSRRTLIATTVGVSYAWCVIWNWRNQAMAAGESVASSAIHRISTYDSAFEGKPASRKTTPSATVGCVKSHRAAPLPPKRKSTTPMGRIEASLIKGDDL